MYPPLWDMAARRPEHVPLPPYRGEGRDGGKLDIAAAPACTPTLILPRRGGRWLLSPPHKIGAEQYWQDTGGG